MGDSSVIGCVRRCRSVGFGTDIEGVGENWVVNDYQGVRTVIDQLQQLKMPPDTIERVAYRNYARVLKDVLK